MHTSFTEIRRGLYRLDVPFDHLFTSVFYLSGDTPIIIDAATTKEDVYERILPALTALGAEKLSGTLLLTHRHGDHSGGAQFLSEALPTWRLGVLSPSQTLGPVTAIPLGGHTEDSMGYFDTRTGTLLCGDGLQFYGVGKYGCSIVDAALYEATLTRVTELGADSILPSHDFIGGSAAAIGENAVSELLANAKAVWEEIKAFIHAHDGAEDPFAVVRAWKEEHPTLPPLPSITVKSVRAANQA